MLESAPPSRYPLSIWSPGAPCACRPRWWRNSPRPAPVCWCGAGRTSRNRPPAGARVDGSPWPAATGGGSSKGAVTTSGSLRVGWAPLDNVVFDVGAGYYNFNYNEDNRTDQFYLFDVGAKYFLNEYLYTTLRYAHERRDSTSNSLDYRDNRVMLTIGGQL